MVVPGWTDPQTCLKVFYRDDVDAGCLWAVHAEAVNLTVIVAPSGLWIPMVAVAAANGEPDSALAQATRLALDASEGRSVIDDEVAPSVLTERGVDVEAGNLKREHDCERGAIAD